MKWRIIVHAAQQLLLARSHAGLQHHFHTCRNWSLSSQWLEMRPSRQQCPVCKAGISKEKVIPLYGRGSASQEDPRYGARPRQTPSAPPDFVRCHSGWKRPPDLRDREQSRRAEEGSVNPTFFWPWSSFPNSLWCLVWCLPRCLRRGSRVLETRAFTCLSASVRSPSASLPQSSTRTIPFTDQVSAGQRRPVSLKRTKMDRLQSKWDRI